VTIATGGSAAPPRSSMFLPAHVRRFVASAATSGADAVVLDLEDSVPPGQKDEARARLADAAKVLGASAELVVRINSEPSLIESDLAACAAIGADGILLPKVTGPGDMDTLHRMLRRLGYVPQIGILVESCAGLMRIREILNAAGPLRSVALGVEDLRHELEVYAPGGDGDSPTVLWAHGTLVVAATAAGVTPLGILGSIGELSDLDRLERGARAAWRMGYRGAYCIHPKQVPRLNAAYAPDEKDLRWADTVIGAATGKIDAGLGAFIVDGQMVDAPLLERARRIRRAHDVDRRSSTAARSAQK
jgi:citrate lyase subunit beta/citryl-CoA lyase